MQRKIKLPKLKERKPKKKKKPAFIQYDPTNLKIRKSEHTSLRTFLMNTGLQPAYEMGQLYEREGELPVKLTHTLLYVKSDTQDYYEVVTALDRETGYFTSEGKLVIDDKDGVVVFKPYDTLMQKLINKVDLTNIPATLNQQIFHFFTDSERNEIFTDKIAHDLPESESNLECMQKMELLQGAIYIKENNGCCIEVIHQAELTGSGRYTYSASGYLSPQKDNTLVYTAYPQPEARGMVRLDPSRELSPARQRLLEALLKDSLQKEKTYLSPGLHKLTLPKTGETIYIDLDYGIVQKKQVPKKPQWEVMKTRLGTGAHSEVYASGGKLRLGKNGLTRKESGSVIKFQMHSEAFPVDKVQTEYELNNRTPHLFSHAEPTIFDINGKTFSCSFIPHLQGKDLFDYFQETVIKFGPDKVLRLMLELAYALQEQIKEAGIVHRDIKLENFIVRRVDGQFYVYAIDLGLSKLAERKDAREFVGTPEYVAPEILNGEGSTDKSDIFSLDRIFGVFMGQEIITPEGHDIQRNANKVEEEGQYDAVCEHMSLDTAHKEILRDLCYFMGKRNPEERASIFEVISKLQQVIWERQFAGQPECKEKVEKTVAVAQDIRLMLRMLKPADLKHAAQEVEEKLNQLPSEASTFALLAKISGAHALGGCKSKQNILDAITGIAAAYESQVSRLRDLLFKASHIDSESSSIIVNKINHALQKCENPRITGINKIVELTEKLAKAAEKANKRLASLQDEQLELEPISEPNAILSESGPSKVGVFARSAKARKEEKGKEKAVAATPPERVRDRSQPSQGGSFAPKPVKHATQTELQEQAPEEKQILTP